MPPFNRRPPRRQRPRRPNAPGARGPDREEPPVRVERKKRHAHTGAGRPPRSESRDAQPSESGGQRERGARPTKPRQAQTRESGPNWGPPRDGMQDRPGRGARTEARRGPTATPGIPRHSGTKYLYGINPIARALEQGRRKLYRLWLREGRMSEGLESLQSAMQAHGLPIGVAPVDRLTDLAGNESHQGAVLECGMLPLGTE